MSDEENSRSSETSNDPDEHASPDYDDVLDHLEELEEVVDDPEERELVRRSMRTARRASSPRVFGNVIRGFDWRDATEVFLGSIIFGIPMLVEGGTLEIGEYIARHPPYFILTLGLGVGLAVGIIYVAEFQEVEVTNPILGFVPRRLVGVITISFTTALVLMTVWGRVDWSTPWVALCQTTVTFVVMVIGASLGDIIPGT